MRVPHFIAAMLTVLSAAPGWPSSVGRQALAALEPASPGDEPRMPRSILPGLDPSHDPREPVDPSRLPWSALGRVQAEAGGGREGNGLFCTGALVGPRTVLTAAHCLVSAQTRRFLQPSTVGFVLGHHRGTHAGYARAVAFSVAPGFDPYVGGPPGADWALLTLEVPLGALGTILPLAREAPPVGAPVAIAGYQQDRREVLLADPDCRILGEERDAAGNAVLRHSCAATRGATGAPLLIRTEDGGWAVAGLAVRTAHQRSPGTGFAGVVGGLAVPATATQ